MGNRDGDGYGFGGLKYFERGCGPAGSYNGNGENSQPGLSPQIGDRMGNGTSYGWSRAPVRDGTSYGWSMGLVGDGSIED